MSEYLGEPEDFSLTQQYSVVHQSWSEQCEAIARVMGGKEQEHAYDSMQAGIVEHFETDLYTFLGDYFEDTEYTSETAEPMVRLLVGFHIDPIATIIDSRLELDLECFDVTKLYTYKNELIKSIVGRVDEKIEDYNDEKFDPLAYICEALAMEVTGIAYKLYHELSDRPQPRFDRIKADALDIGKVALGVVIGNVAHGLITKYLK